MLWSITRIAWCIPWYSPTQQFFDMFGWPRAFILFFWRRWGCARILLPFRRLWLCYRNYIIRSVLVQRQSFVICICFLICKLLILFIFWCRLKYSPGWYVHMYNLATPSLFVHQSHAVGRIKHDSLARVTLPDAFTWLM
jgi:hypothetical protein